VVGQSERLKEEMDKAERAMGEAETVRDSKLTAFNNAEKAYNTAKGEMEAYEQEHADLIPLIGKGTLGFFTYVGADDAVDVLKNAQYASSTKIGEQGDATSLESMVQVFSPLRTCNTLREEGGLKALKLTDRMMAIAQSDINWIDSHLEKPGQFEVVEMFTCGYLNPYQIWFDSEMEDEGENYRTIMSSDYTVTGFGYCNANRSGQYEYSHCQVFGKGNGEQTFTVDEYEARFNEYCDQIYEVESDHKTITDKVSAAKKEMEAAESEYNSAQSAYEKAAKTYQSAKNVYEWYD